MTGKKRFGILVFVLIVILGARVAYSFRMQTDSKAERERALEWLNKEPSYDSKATHYRPVRPKPVAGPILRKFSKNTFLVTMSGGPALRIGLDPSLKFDQAENTAAFLNGKCVSKFDNPTPCPEAVKIDEKVWSEITVCPEQLRQIPTLTGWSLSAASTRDLALYCSPASTCKKIPDGQFQFEISAKPPPSSLRLGEIFNLIWKNGVCIEGQHKVLNPSKIEKVLVTSE